VTGSVQLHPKDQVKYGAPPSIPFDLNELGVKQRAAFERETKRTLKWFFNQLQGVPELDEHQNPIPVPVVNPDGSPKLDDAGNPVVKMKLTRDPEVFAMYAWLALWGHGIRVPYETFDVIEVGLRIDYGNDETDEDVDEGKAPATDSESSTSPTETSPTG